MQKRIRDVKTGETFTRTRDLTGNIYRMNYHATEKSPPQYSRWSQYFGWTSLYSAKGDMLNEEVFIVLFDDNGTPYIPGGQ